MGKALALHVRLKPDPQRQVYQPLDSLTTDLLRYRYRLPDYRQLCRARLSFDRVELELLVRLLLLARAFDGLLQNSLEGLVVAIFLKNRHPCISAVKHMINQPAVRCTFWPSHARKLPIYPSLVKKRFLTRMALPGMLGGDWRSVDGRSVATI